MTDKNDTHDGDMNENVQPKNDDSLNSTLLDRFIHARQQDDPVATPEQGEAYLAEDLMALADKIHLKSEFHTQMLNTLNATQQGKTPTASATKPPNQRVIDFPYINLYTRPRKRGGRIPFTLGAALVVMVAFSAVLFSLSPSDTADTDENNILPIRYLPEALPLPVGGYVERVSPATFDMMQETGMTWVAYSLRFSQADAEADLNRAYEMIENAHSAGFRLMLRVTGTAVELERMGEDYFPMFAEFLSEVAAFHPDAIQVWHQPNVDSVWFQNDVDAATYVEMLRQAYDAIKAVDENVMVISAAPAPTGAASAFPGQIINDDTYYQDMATAGIADVADCIGVTYVEGTVSPDLVYGDQRDSYATRYFVPMLRRAAASFMNADMPLCITQMGYNAPEEFADQLTPAFLWANQNTLAEQAEWLREAILIAADFEDSPVEMLLVWNMHYSQYESPVNGYALIRPNETCLA
ncbi:MAG: hypothetical protein RLP44_10245, partial [Aggregatilineales bacterium]